MRLSGLRLSSSSLRVSSSSATKSPAFVEDDVICADLEDEIADFEAEFDQVLPGSVGCENGADKEVVNIRSSLPPLFFKEDLVGHLLALGDSDAKWVLERFAAERGNELFKEVMADGERRQSQWSQLSQQEDKAVENGHAEEEDEVATSLPGDSDGPGAGRLTMALKGDLVTKNRLSTGDDGSIVIKTSPSGKGAFLRRSVCTGPLDEFGDKREYDAHLAKQELPMVQFSAFMYFCNETESVMTLDVMRIGNSSTRSEVHFTTRDATAIAGARYVATSGKIVFEPGEFEKDISIPILFTHTWDTTTEFRVDLIKTGEQAPVDCTLGRYLWTTRVKVIDSGCFPSRKYQEEIQNRQLSKVNPWKLIYEYFKLDYSNPIVKKGTIKTLMLGQCHNLYLLLKLFMNVYLVDEVLQDGSKLIGGSQEGCLVLLGVLLVLPFGLLHIGDYKEPSWKVGGASRAVLQKALMRKFLNYCEAARSELNQGALTMAMARDSIKLVHEGYLSFLDMIKSTGQLIMIFLFLALAPPILDTQPRVSGFVILVLFPTVLISFLLWRQKRTTEYVHQMDRAQDALVGQVDRNVINYRMIADYNRRPYFVARYEARIKDFNKVAILEAQVLRNNLYCPQWLTVLCVSIYTLVGGLQVVDQSVPLEERLSLGMFLANLNVIAITGAAWGDIYRVLLDMQRVFPALETIVTLLNLPIDIPQRMALNRHRRAKTSELRTELRKQGCPGLPLDYLPITLINVEFSYAAARVSGSSKGGPGGGAGGINSKGKITVQQGTLVSLVGPRGEGKSTILKIIGGVILPEPGSFFIPSHLRVLHMSSEPLFYLGSLYDNLTFGITPGDADGEISRVSEICRRLDLPERIHKWIQAGQGGEVLVWGEVLSYTQRCLLCVARSLVTNPEVLCIHKPTMSYDEKTSVRVLTLLKEFVADKGVVQDLKTRHRRRPRTCIFTSSKIQGVDMSDEVYLVSKSEGIRRVDKMAVSVDMLG